MINLLFKLMDSWAKGRNPPRIKQLVWEKQQVDGILRIMDEDGSLDKMTGLERAELDRLLGKEYPLWHKVYVTK